jgi:hypothetical protein
MPEFIDEISEQYRHPYKARVEDATRDITTARIVQEGVS